MILNVKAIFIVDILIVQEPVSLDGLIIIVAQVWHISNFFIFCLPIYYIKVIHWIWYSTCYILSPITIRICMLISINLNWVIWLFMRIITVILSKKMCFIWLISNHRNQFQKTLPKYCSKYIDFINYRNRSLGMETNKKFKFGFNSFQNKVD